MIRDAAFLSPDAWIALTKRQDVDTVDLDPATPLAPTSAKPLFGIPIVKDDRVPHWIVGIMIGRVSGERTAMLPGGRICLVRSPVDFVLEGESWIADGAAIAPGTCFLSLTPIEPGDMVWRPTAGARSAFPLARVKETAIDTIRTFDPRIRYR